MAKPKPIPSGGRRSDLNKAEGSQLVGTSVQIPESRRRWVLLAGLLSPLLVLGVWGALKLNPQAFTHRPKQLPLSSCVSAPGNEGPLFACPVKPTDKLEFSLGVEQAADDSISLGLAIRRTGFLMDRNQLRVEIKGTAVVRSAGDAAERAVPFDNTMMNKFATFKEKSKNSHIFRYLTIPDLAPGDSVSVQVERARVYKSVLGDYSRELFQDGDVGIALVAEADPYKLVYWRIMTAKGVLAAAMLLLLLQQLWQVACSFRNRTGYRWKDLLVLPLILVALLDFTPDCFVAWGKAQTPSSQSMQSHFSSLKTMLIHHLNSTLITWCFNFYSLIHFGGRYTCLQYLIVFLAIGSALGLYSRLGVLADTYHVTEPLHGLSQLGYRSEIIWKISFIMHSASIGLGVLFPLASVIVAQFKPKDPVPSKAGEQKLGNSIYTVTFGSTFLILQYYIIGKKYYIGDWNLWRVILEHSLLCIAVIVFVMIPCLEPFGHTSLLPEQISVHAKSAQITRSEFSDEEIMSLSKH